MEQIFSDEQLAMLQAKLSTEQIKHKYGGLKFIKGDAAIDAANRIFGYGRWGYRVVGRSHEQITDMSQVNEAGEPLPRLVDMYYADVEVWVEGMAGTMAGDGVGIVIKPFGPEAHEKARKEATTDALKRALRHFGDQFGLSLYDPDDYVETPSGEPVQVKDVRPGVKYPPKAAPVPPAFTRPIPPPAEKKTAGISPDQKRAIVNMAKSLKITPPEENELNKFNAAMASKLIEDLSAQMQQKRKEANERKAQAS